MTSYTAVRLPLVISSESALHIGTGFGLAQILDDRATRGPHPFASRAGVLLPYIPGASLKGRLRFHAASLLRALAPERSEALLTALFGSASSPGRLIFPDAHLAPEVEAQVAAGPDGGDARAGALLPLLALEERSNVALSRARRAAREHMLLRMEVAAPQLSYTCAIYGRLPAGQDRPGLALLALAAHATTHLGGAKGRGLGAVRVELNAADPPTLGDETFDVEAIAKELEKL